MPPKQPPPSAAAYAPNAKKRKAPPTSDPSSAALNGPPSKKHKPTTTSTANHHRAKQRDARSLATQTSSKAFANGALDVDKFVKAREYEIHALEQGIRRSKGALNRRAFQQVPWELRRRGAAHDAKRVVKRLRGRARREMAEDNTPTVKRGKGKAGKGTRGWVRVETAKKLRALGGTKEKAKEGKPTEQQRQDTGNAAVPARTPKIKTATLAKPPLPKSKFRKRQKNKSWLPTHLFHAKRAHMTPPSAPMWRFALPLSPTQKSYRPTHRAVGERGAVCWDTSYLSTIGLEGEEWSMLGMLRGLGVEEAWLTAWKGRKWRDGLRVVETMVYERETPHDLIAPVTVVWCAMSAEERGRGVHEDGKRKRSLFLRVHPSAFPELWEEVIRLSKVAKPAVRVEDLRFELGSIELKGPGSTEALLGALWPSWNDMQAGSVEHTFTNLAGLTNAATLPSGALLGFDIQDPKLHFPPRTVKPSRPANEQDSTLLELLSSWPADDAQYAPAIFDRKARHLGSKLPSQKAVNRRKSLAAPGKYPSPRPEDPHIPIVIYVSTAPSGFKGRQQQQVSYHLLAPWKAIQPIWYSLMYYPLSTGQQPRFGGLDEQRQLASEAGVPWFPGDFPGTKAGWQWEVGQRRKRWEEWKRRPRGKRIAWESVQVGPGKEGRGEVGVGWACDWEGLVEGFSTRQDSAAAGAEGAPKVLEDQADASKDEQADKAKPPATDADFPSSPLTRPPGLAHVPSASAHALINNPLAGLPANHSADLLTVRLTLLTRGVPHTCARIYRLPSTSTNPKLRAAWLALHPSHRQKHKQRKKAALPYVGKDAPDHIRQQRLAASLLEPPRAGGEDYPVCPGKEDLVGFVTSGGYDLASGGGRGVGCALLGKVAGAEGWDGDEGRLCVVRNAGESVGRLGMWEMV